MSNETKTHDFQVGDVVCLKSGSPRLTIIRIGKPTEKIPVIWFSRLKGGNFTHIQRHEYPAGLLEIDQFERKTDTLTFGDVVRLKGGGPKMVIADFVKPDERCRCEWFNTLKSGIYGEPHMNYLPPEALELVEGEEG